MKISTLKALEKVKSLQSSIKNSNFLNDLFPKSFLEVSHISDMNTFVSNINKYHSKISQGFDYKCLDQVLLEPVWDVLERPSKCIRAMLVYNFNQLAKIEDDKFILHLCAFIEILHSLTLIIGSF